MSQKPVPRRRLDLEVPMRSIVVLIAAMTACGCTSFDYDTAMKKCETGRAALIASEPGTTHHDYCPDQVQGEAQIANADAEARSSAIVSMPIFMPHFAPPPPAVQIMPTFPRSVTCNSNTWAPGQTTTTCQ